MNDVQHMADGCVGYWLLTGDGRARRIECDVCHTVVEASAINRRRARRENIMGSHLTRLAAEGAGYRVWPPLKRRD